MFDFTKIGCNSKPRFEELRTILKNALKKDILKDWIDASDLTEDLAYSIDTVGLLDKNNLETSARSAIIHSSSDLHCRGYKVEAISLSLIVNHEKLSNNEISSLISYLDHECKNQEIFLGKSHTVFGDANWVTIAAIGRETHRQKDPMERVEYSIILTKKLGAMRTYCLNQISKNDPLIKSEAIHTLELSHHTVVDLLSSATTATTDVSGNGLLGTAYLLSQKFSLNMLIDTSSIEVSGLEYNDIPISCSSKNNRDAFQAALSFKNEIPENLSEILFAPEYSGPIITLINAKEADEFLNKLHQRGFKDACIIGKAYKDSPYLEIT